MKKIIFKLFLISLFTCLSFFSIDKVYALNVYDLKPDSMYSCNADGSVCGSNSGDRLNLYSTSMPGTNFYGWPFSSRYSLLRFTYTNLGLDTSSSKNFNVTFKFFDNQYNNVSQDALLNLRPAVNVNGKVCDVAFSSGIHFNDVISNGGMLGRYSNFISISCDNVNLESDFIVVELYKAGSTSLGGGEVGISNIFTISPSSDLGSIQNDTNNKIDDLNETQKETNNKLDEANKQAKETNDYLKDDDTSGANNEAESFFSGFTTNTHGLTSVITAPLELIGNIIGSTCTPLQVPLPFVDTNLILPCMSTIYNQYFGSFYTLYKTITFGIVSYWVCVRIFALVKDFKNPDHDEIEVMDL